MPSTQYLYDNKQSGTFVGFPCMLLGFTIHENALGAVDAYICDTNEEVLQNVVFVIRTIPFRAVHISFPEPVYFSQGIYIEALGSTPTITLELL